MADIIQAVKNELTFENVLVTAMKVPGVKINRANFLRKELIKYYNQETVEQAIQFNPAKAGVKKEVINKISQEVINYETRKVTAISFAASLPGGAAVPGAVSADIISYFGFILRAAQELAYLYGFEQFDLNDDEVDVQTKNEILLFVGVMFGVQEAAKVLMVLADVLTKQVAKKLTQKALTKGTVYPIVKTVAKAIGARMTKQIFADGVASFIPVVSGLLSGGLTYALFKPCCVRLRDVLKTYNLCDPDYYRTIEAEFSVAEDIIDEDVNIDNHI